MKVLLTGIAGSGKTSAVNALRAQGYNAIDLDDSDVCAWVNKQTGEQTDYVAGAGKEWIENHRWQVIPTRLLEALSSFAEDVDVFVGGKIARTQAREIANIFDVVYLLKPPNSIVDERLRTRTTNIRNFGREREERDYIVKNRNDFERACERVGAIPLENRGSIEELLDAILRK